MPRKGESRSAAKREAAEREARNARRRARYAEKKAAERAEAAARAERNARRRAAYAAAKREAARLEREAEAKRAERNAARRAKYAAAKAIERREAERAALRKRKQKEARERRKKEVARRKTTAARLKKERARRKKLDKRGKAERVQTVAAKLRQKLEAWKVYADSEFDELRAFRSRAALAINADGTIDAEFMLEFLGEPANEDEVRHAAQVMAGTEPKRLIDARTDREDVWIMAGLTMGGAFVERYTTRTNQTLWTNPQHFDGMAFNGALDILESPGGMIDSVFDITDAEEEVFGPSAVRQVRVRIVYNPQGLAPLRPFR
jgi:hypothetical protein